MALSAYQQELRDRFLAAPVTAAPPPWRRVAVVPVGGLVGVGFGPDPVDGRDLLMVVSHGGHRVFDAAATAGPSTW